MRTTDLRIGNFIQDQFGDIITVDGLDDMDVFSCDCGDIPVHAVQPIPLTEQWLLDFWFNQSIEGQWYVYFDEMCLTIYEDLPQYIVEIHDMEMDKSSIFLMSIKYVHQLQNLYFALTQEELILKEKTL